MEAGLVFPDFYFYIIFSRQKFIWNSIITMSGIDSTDTPTNLTSCLRMQLCMTPSLPFNCWYNVRMRNKFGSALQFVAVFINCVFNCRSPLHHVPPKSAWTYIWQETPQTLITLILPLTSEKGGRWAGPIGSVPDWQLRGGVISREKASALSYYPPLYCIPIYTSKVSSKVDFKVL